MSWCAIILLAAFGLFVVAIIADALMGSVFFWIKTDPRNRGEYIRRYPFGKDFDQ